MKAFLSHFPAFIEMLATGMFSCTQCVTSWGVHHDNTTLGGGLQVDIINSSSCSSDYSQVGTLFNDLCCHLCCRSHHNSLIILQLLYKLVN